MVFSTILFLFRFLPLVLGMNFLIHKKLRNAFLLLASLFFYAWGENLLVLLMVASILGNYLLGLLISKGKEQENPSLAKVGLWGGIGANLLILLFFKYIHFIKENLQGLGLEVNWEVEDITLPLGISFFTFQSLSYLIDVYRRDVDAQKNPIHLGLYIALFPQLIAGPIVRYLDIAHEIKNRVMTQALFLEGVVRFIRGLGKKVLIANTMGLVADQVFALSTDETSTALAWIGAISYSLQIFFDFSGYSDMAIGLGKMFGFNFKENFLHPYVATSIQDFWKRWHISLSTWFRDYLYIPLGGNRKGKMRTYFNLVLVFFVTGLWHGASWNFVFWGLFHGGFLLIERSVSISLPKKLSFLKHLYLLLVVMVGWVFFRADDFDHGVDYLKRMIVFESGTNNTPWLYLNHYFLIIAGFGVLFSMPIRTWWINTVVGRRKESPFFKIGGYLLYLFIFVYSVFELATSTYNPFIYFRF